MIHNTDAQVEEIKKKAELKGWQDCLDAVRGSLESYPNGGGDIEIMKQVQRIQREARLAALEALESVQPTVEFYLKREINSPSNHQEFAKEAYDKLERFRRAITSLCVAASTSSVGASEKDAE